MKNSQESGKMVLFGENGCFLLKKYRKTQKRLFLWENAQNS